MGWFILKLEKSWNFGPWCSTCALRKLNMTGRRVAGRCPKWRFTAWNIIYKYHEISVNRGFPIAAFDELNGTVRKQKKSSSNIMKQLHLQWFCTESSFPWWRPHRFHGSGHNGNSPTGSLKLVSLWSLSSFLMFLSTPQHILYPCLASPTKCVNVGYSGFS